MDPHAAGDLGDVMIRPCRIVGFLCFRSFHYPSHPSAMFSMRPHLLLSGRTVHPEIPEGDTPEEIELAAKMREAREVVSGAGCV